MSIKIKDHAKAPDPIAAISGGLLSIAGMLGLRERFGIDLTADELAEILGIVVTVAASVRHWWEMRKRRAAVLPAEADDDGPEYAGRPTGPEFVSGDSEASEGGR